MFNIPLMSDHPSFKTPFAAFWVVAHEGFYCSNKWYQWEMISQGVPNVTTKNTTVYGSQRKKMASCRSNIKWIRDKSKCWPDFALYYSESHCTQGWDVSAKLLASEFFMLRIISLNVLKLIHVSLKHTDFWVFCNAPIMCLWPKYEKWFTKASDLNAGSL